MIFQQLLNSLRNKIIHIYIYCYSEMTLWQSKQVTPTQKRAITIRPVFTQTAFYMAASYGLNKLLDAHINDRRVTNINVLLTISMHYQKKMLSELIK